MRYRKNKIQTFLCVAVCAALFATIGCGRKTPDGFPKLVPCSVSVVQDGKPLEGAVVSFNADDMKWSVSGTTDASGVAKIYTHGAYPGSPTGEFKVTIQKQIVEGGGGVSEQSASIMPTAEVAYDLVDLKFKSLDETPLKITVSGKTNESFDVGAPVREAIKAL